MRPEHSQAVKLLTRVIASGHFDVSQLAAELVTDERTLGRYLTGDLPMPIEQQVCLAKLVIGHVPVLSRQGRNLLSQVKAKIDFEKGETIVHNFAPPTRF